MPTPRYESLDQLVDKLKNGEPYSLVNFCDGEWIQILGRNSGSNVDGHDYTDLGRDLLINVIRDSQPLYFCTQFGRFYDGVGETIDSYLSKSTMESWKETNEAFKLFKSLGIGSEIFWCERGKILYEFESGNVGPLFNEIKKKKTMVVGPPHLRNLDVINPISVIGVPTKNALLDHQRLIDECMKSIESLKPEVVTVSAGFLSKVLINELFKIYGQSIWFIDFGSMWDPFCGVASRRSHRRPRWKNSEAKIREYLATH